MKKTKKRKVSSERLPDRASELLINHRILWAVRDELKADIRAVDTKIVSMDAKFESLDAKIESVDSKLGSLDAKIESVDSKVDSVANRISAEIHKVRSDVQRVIALVEEQNNRNRAVLDGYQSLYDRQDRVEKKVDQLEMTVLDFKKISR
jgi:chromosome segregation ATPase